MEYALQKVFIGIVCSGLAMLAFVFWCISGCNRAKDEEAGKAEPEGERLILR